MSAYNALPLGSGSAGKKTVSYEVVSQHCRTVDHYITAAVENGYFIPRRTGGLVTR